MKPTRVETDSFGKLEVPIDKYWGAQTQRSLKNFDIGQEKHNLSLIYGLITIKQAAAVVNMKHGMLTKKLGNAIIRACKEILSGKFDDNFPYDKKVDNKTAIGNDKTRKLGKLKRITFIAVNRGKPYSKIFLIRSNITPTDNEIIVKAEIANSIGGMIWPTNHLSIKGIEIQGEIIWLIIFFILKKNIFLFELFL